MHRLVHAHRAAEAGRRQHADGSRQHGGLVAQDVAEHVGGHDHVELLGVPNELHGAVVHQHVLELHVSVAFLTVDPGHDLAPQLRGLEHVGLVHRGHAPSPPARGVEGHPGDPLDLRCGIDQGVDAAFGPVRPGRHPLGLPEVDAAGQFPDHHQVGPFHHLGLESGSLRQGREQLHRPQVGEQAQLPAQGEQRPLGTDGIVQSVPLGSAHGAQDHRVAGLGQREDLVGQGPSVGVDGSSPHQPLLDLHREAEEVRGLPQHRHGFRHHFRTDAVARKNRNLAVHGPPSTGA